ncbi:MAG: hypothetical protein EXQ56_09450 [Acidobacteria bacterium]|nr:hypothetical protein [Acidobacteriota bacterium]
MRRTRICWRRWVPTVWYGLLLLCLTVSSDAAPRADLAGGPTGTVKTSKGFSVEGVMVQLISQKTSIRTTVFTNEAGQYEFPKLEAGVYTLRTPRPLEFKRVIKEGVQISGATRLPEITLERVTESEFLPPTPDILSQLSDAEWLHNLDGTAQEKRVFSNTCGTGCHTYQMQFRSRFDERSWRLIMHRMLDYNGRILQGPGDGEVSPAEQAEREIIIKWLARVRGPDAQDPPLKVFPRPQGPATRAVITEYELPWLGVHVHDVFGDTKSDGIWFDINRSPLIGKLDPKSGKVASWKIPGTPSKHPGAHWIQAAPDGTVWYSETWSQSLIHFNPLTEIFRKMSSGVQGNMALAPDGTIWRTAKDKISRFDRETAKIVEQFPPDSRKIPNTYGNFISWDGRYFGGGNRDRTFDGVVFMDRQTKEVRMIPSPSGVSAASRGSFDPDGNIWVGGRGGVLVKYDHKNNRIAEYAPPTPNNTFYETRADKNGEVWAGEMRAGRIARFNPKTHGWVEYVLPEPFSFDWQTYVDNSTDPVTVWYGDQYGYIVRIQPLE